ncbi:unnamed protein product [[Candida] boidinii]|nr:unnamed protein product [[Candida] boidinii]
MRWRRFLWFDDLSTFYVGICGYGVVELNRERYQLVAAFNPLNISFSQRDEPLDKNKRITNKGNNSDRVVNEETRDDEVSESVYLSVYLSVYYQSTISETGQNKADAGVLIMVLR